VALARVRTDPPAVARAVRARARLSQAEIAAACGVTPAAVSRWEAGNRKPRGEAARRYAGLIEILDQAVPAGDARPGGSQHDEP
jgi:transcriptional regulator with XRE-family HTH domain